jgi:putative flavoprotein involved in K+ transport
MDSLIEQRNLELPTEVRAAVVDPPRIVKSMRRLDSRAAGLSSVIWATGYTFDLGWIDLPVLSEQGAPVHDHGVASVPGIYFLGLPWLSRMNSSFLSGVGADAARLADHIFAAACSVNA